MGKQTKIEWCHSTVNGQIGCDGCELWIPKAGVRSCYAGNLVEKRAGLKGWPQAFDKPEIYLERIYTACKWGPPTEAENLAKPWLRGYPRVIFLDDLGDTFTESLPLMWIEPAIEAMAKSPHIWQFLTKRPKRMAQFFANTGHVPANFWLMTTVTSEANIDRVRALCAIDGATVRGISYEPIWGPLGKVLDYIRPDAANWLIGGGASGSDAKAWNPAWARDARDRCGATGVPFFWKQHGEWAPHKMIAGGDVGGDMRRDVVRIVKSHGGDSDGHFRRGDAMMQRVGKAKAGRLLDGRTWDEFPTVTP